MATTFAPHTPAKQVKRRRHVLKVGESVYQVISRDRSRRYRIALLYDGTTVCDCVAGRNGIDCWHSQAVRERRGGGIA